jgi:hypothetical protein
MQASKQKLIKMKAGYSFWTTIIILTGMIASIIDRSPNYLALGICVGIVINFILGKNPLKEEA